MTEQSVDATAARTKPVVSTALAVVGVVHLAIVGLLFSEGVRSIIDAGVFASIEADPAASDLRGNAFWYETTGVALLLLAGLVFWIERTYGSVPVFLGWALLALAVWGIIFMPLSPFWIFVPIAGLAFWSARRGQQNRQDAPPAAVPAQR